MSNCNTCGGFVSPDFVRVFGSNENELFACPNCAPMSAIADAGFAAGAHTGH